MVKQSKYVGLPLVVGTSKASTLQFIKDKLANRLSNWKGKTLSSAGKELLSKSMALALPSYAMLMFKFPKGLCKELSNMMARFW